MLWWRETKGGPSQLPFPIAKPHDWLQRENSSRKRKGVKIKLNRINFCPPFNDRLGEGQC
jgi:hypothetical protein